MQGVKFEALGLMLLRFSRMGWLLVGSKVGTMGRVWGFRFKVKGLRFTV